jgi:membrane protein insertase Oxa1/YidC/SpoIIIJ
VNAAILYPFVPAPESIAPAFLGVFSVMGASITLALLAAATQFLYGLYSLPVPEKPAPGTKPDMQAEFARSLSMQMRFILPVVVGIAAYATSVAIALYFITSNLVGLAQEWFVRREKARVS